MAGDRIGLGPLFGTLLGCAVLLLGPAVAQAARPLYFEKIVDTRTTLPSGDRFIFLDTRPALSGRDVVFAGQFMTAWNEAKRGVQARLGGVIRPVAAVGDPAPGRQARLVQVGAPSIHRGVVVLAAQDDENGAAVYAWDGALRPLVDASTPVPGHGTTFTDFASPVVATGGVAFLGLVDNAVAGVYRLAGGSLSLIADAATPVPGGVGNLFAAFTPPVLEGDTTAFAAFGRFDGQSYSEPGLYAGQAGRLAVLLGPATLIPGRDAPFVEMAQPVLGGGAVAFRGFGPTPEDEGLYLLKNNVLTVIADDRTTPPGANYRFRSFAAVSLSQGGYAFAGQDLLGNPSVWATIGLEPGETIRRVAGLGDLLDGRTVLSAECSSQALDGDRVAVWVGFDDGSQGVYLASTRPAANAAASLGPGPRLLLIGRDS